ncbi:hypothetical protein F53441_1664 [Fusarium austroafricanum]|uniref:SRCR domain-containing protein n=1 Tax=Fusarium austroafricanum TaxID=2364996 RepID=A0A8H4P201_9HYPO|nr:hypothetical protein F53441_1664 [Fusarium austroafricanum]
MRFHILLSLAISCMASPCKPSSSSSDIATPTSELSFAESSSAVSSVTWSASSTKSTTLETSGTSTIASTESSGATSSVTLSPSATESTSLETFETTAIASTVSVSSTYSASTMVSTSNLNTETASPTTTTKSLFRTTTDSSDITTSSPATASSTLTSATIAPESTDSAITSVPASTSTSDSAISTTSISTIEAETSFTSTAVSTTGSTTTSPDTTTTSAAALPTFKAVVQNAPGAGHAIGWTTSPLGYGSAWRQTPLMTIEPDTGHLVMNGNARVCGVYFFVGPNARTGYARLQSCVEPMLANSAHVTCEMDHADGLQCSIPALTCVKEDTVVTCTDSGAKWTQFYAESVISGVSWLVALGTADKKSPDLAHSFEVSAQIA